MHVLRVSLQTLLAAALPHAAAAATPPPAAAGRDAPAGGDTPAAAPASPPAAAPTRDGPLPELARRRIDAALADLDTGHFADTVAGLLVLHAAGDPARGRAMIRYAARRAPQARAELTRALKLADLDASTGAPVTPARREDTTSARAVSGPPPDGARSEGPAIGRTDPRGVLSARGTLRPPRGRLASPQFR